jgi:PhnB protein
MTPNIYLFFNGDCFEAMSHYAEVLGGEIVSVSRNADAPDPESRMPGGDDAVMNMQVRLGEALMMGSDAPPDWYQAPQGFRVQLAAGSRAEFDRLYGALCTDGASVQMAPDETFWAERFAMFTDRFGTPWMLNFDGSRRSELERS